MTPLTALSPIDGRYASKADSLRPYLSEFGLIKARVTVEIRWLQSLADNSAIGELAAFDDQTNAFLNAIVDDFSEADAQAIKDIEDIVMGKLHGLCIGLDVCSTLHMDVSLDDLDWCLDRVMPANPAYLMALPTRFISTCGSCCSKYPSIC